MSYFLEHLIARAWNRLSAPSNRANDGGPRLDLGAIVVDGEVSRMHLYLPDSKRCEHAAILGKTGQGKSYFLRYLSSQDVRNRHGFVFFDLHGDTMPFLLRLVAAEERRRGTDLSDRLIVIEPGDPEFSIGLNVLEAQAGPQNYVQLAEFAQILKARWNLDSFGARTEELLRNCLHVLADSGLTLLELSLLLTNAAFRTMCLQRVENTEVTSYFRTRFDTRSEAMQGVYREAILNKVSGFTTDRRFRHILGQQRSTFSLLDAMERGRWVILNLDKGRLGEQASTLGSLLLTKLKNALFARSRRQLFTLYCDEIQNLVAYDAGLDTLLSEARKFGISVVSANQFLEQYPSQMRAAIMAVGTHIFFQLSSTDADRIASSLDGGKRLAEILKNLPKRRFVVKSGSERPREALVPMVADSEADYTSLYNRCRARWARRRVDIESEITQRQRRFQQRNDEVLNAWE
jgi:Type IV secretion-system coupling protein DNA-binding domain